ncbi:MAG: alpha-glucuronidase family glycosyl hydrolase [Planctomycetales bacterium]
MKAIRSSRRLWSAAVVWGALWCAWLAPALQAGPRVDVVIGPQAPALERFAAEEMAGQLRKLFDADARVATESSKGNVEAILVGTPRTNPALAFLADSWPKLSDQGHLVRSVKRNGRTVVAVGGGSPVATLWAAYELGHHFGIRYFLFGDLYPVGSPKFDLEGIDRLLEPSVRLRTWRTINDFPIGPESWGLAEQKQVLQQLAKLKYNRILLAVYPWQPFVDLEFRGVRKESAALWFGWKYRVDGDTAGRGPFKGAKFFDNPEFVGKEGYAERIAAGTGLIRGVIDAAHALGMTAGLAISPLEFSKEFSQVLPNARPSRELEPLTIGPGASQPPDDPVLLDLARTQIRAYLDTYPELDALYLTLPEFPDWVEHADASWKRLVQRTGLGPSVTLEKLVTAARDRTLISSGERGERALRGNIAALDFLHTLLADGSTLKSSTGRKLELTLVDVDSALYPVLDKVVPKGAATLNFVDYTARRVVAHRDRLSQIPAQRVPSSLILTLADDNVGMLPQMSPAALHTLMADLRKLGWQGFSTRYWIVGDLDLSANYLSRASFDAAVTPEEVHNDMVTRVCGEGIADRMWKGFEMIELATALIDQHDLGFSFPVPGVILKHYESQEPVPAWWNEVRELYLNAMNEMYRANTRAREGGQAYSLYFARRCEFAYEYMNCVEATRQAGLARRAGNLDEQRARLEAAVESIHSALNALAAVARSNSDRGVIAVLNEYGYRPLKGELEKLD